MATLKWIMAKPQRMIAAVIVGGGLLAGVGYVGWLAYLMILFAKTPWCGYEVQQEAISPDRIRKAAVVEVNCGAAAPYMDWAVIAPANRPYDFENDAVATAYGRDMRVAWEGRRLVVFWRVDEGHRDRPAQLREGAGKIVELRKF